MNSFKLESNEKKNVVDVRQGLRVYVLVGLRMKILKILIYNILKIIQEKLLFCSII